MLLINVYRKVIHRLPYHHHHTHAVCVLHFIPLRLQVLALRLLHYNLLSFCRYSPVGIVFLIAAKLVEMEDLDAMFEQLAYYMVTVLAGLFIHAFIVLPLIYAVFTRKNPFSFMVGMTKAILTAWGTASR